MTASVQTLADLIAEVAAEHVIYEPVFRLAYGEVCQDCKADWPCKPARLAAALSPENVAAGLEVQHAQFLTDPESFDSREAVAAAILAAMTVAE